MSFSDIIECNLSDRDRRRRWETDLRIRGRCDRLPRRGRAVNSRGGQDVVQIIKLAPRLIGVRIVISGVAIVVIPCSNFGELVLEVFIVHHALTPCPPAVEFEGTSAPLVNNEMSLTSIPDGSSDATGNQQSKDDKQKCVKSR